MNEILKKNGLPTEGAAHITINLVKLIAEQYAKEKVGEQCGKQDVSIVSKLAKITALNERIKELEEQRDFFHYTLCSYRKGGELELNSKEVDKWQRIINLFESVFKTKS